MDIEEKIYTITTKATDVNGNTAEISFDIKVPKTKTIQTEIVNNELIVTDRNSTLYGMKMKGHSGEDISELRLRSVDYGDVWKLPLQNLEPDDVVEKTIFIIDNISPKIDIKLFKDIDTHEKRLKLGSGLFEYVETNFIDTNFWEHKYRNNYEYESTNGFVVNGNGVYLLLIRKSQLRGE
jgi:hypothetical protein